MTQGTVPEKIEEGCIRCLSYFAIFRYPLTAEEVWQFHPYAVGTDEVSRVLDQLVSEEKIFHYQDYFLPEDDISWIEERKAGNERALQILNKTGRYASIISSFPFVRAIAISGSLSKFYASEDPDIDYFIITEAHRLWIARTLLHLFKKLTFLTGHQHYFCMNYFVDTEALNLDHRNLYSAIETVTLLPVFNKELCQGFERSNRWVHDFLPNHPGMNNFNYLLEKRKRTIKRFFEGVIDLLSPAKMNRYLMNVTDRRWRRKWNGHGYSEEDYNRAFQTELHISKNHPADYEKKVLESLRQDKMKESAS